jgi:hypothetical protein
MKRAAILDCSLHFYLIGKGFLVGSINHLHSTALVELPDGGHSLDEWASLSE